MMKKIEKRLYKSVAGNAEDVLDYVLPNGSTIYLSEIGGNGVQKSIVTVKIVWDQGGSEQEIILTTIGDVTQNTTKFFLGNGVRKLSIFLTNNDNTSNLMGGYFMGNELDG